MWINIFEHGQINQLILAKSYKEMNKDKSFLTSRWIKHYMIVLWCCSEIANNGSHLQIFKTMPK